METLFVLKPLAGVVVTAYDAGCDNRGAAKYQATVEVDGEMLFPLDGPIYGAFSPLDSSDGDKAKAHVLYHVSMKPGDTDTEFFDGYTPEQLAFVEAHGEAIHMESIILEEGEPEE